MSPPHPKTAVAPQRGAVIVISAPSGTGKSTLIRRLLRTVSGLTFSVSHTTRPPRPGERDGREYFFVGRAEFRRLIRAGEFVEWARVFGHYYGTSRRQIEQAQAQGRDVVLDIDVQGHRQVRRSLPDAVSIFILPPSYSELERRLRRRHSEEPQVIARRLAAARREVRCWKEYDYLVVNDSLDRAARALRVIVEATRYRRQSQQPRIQAIRKTFVGGKTEWKCHRASTASFASF